MSKRKLDKTDIGEMRVWASSASSAGFLHVQIDSDHAVELCDRALDNDRMAEEIAELRKGLEIMVEQFESDHNCEYEYNIIKWNRDLLAKLNREGEE